MDRQPKIIPPGKVDMHHVYTVKDVPLVVLKHDGKLTCEPHSAGWQLTPDQMFDTSDECHQILDRVLSHADTNDDSVWFNLNVNRNLNKTTKLQVMLEEHGFDAIHDNPLLMLRRRSSVRSKPDLYAKRHHRPVTRAEAEVKGPSTDEGDPDDWMDRGEYEYGTKARPRKMPRTTFIRCSSTNSPKVLIPVDKILKVIESSHGGGSLIILPNKENQIVTQSPDEVEALIAEVQAAWNFRSPQHG